MKFEYFKILKFDFLENEKSFWCEITFFFVLQVLSFNLKNEHNL